MRLALAAWLLLSTAAVAAEEVDYLRQVKPVLAARCVSCHGALKQEASLRLDTVADMRTGGESGPALVAKQAAMSLILARISDTNPESRMPPESDGSPLKPHEIAAIRSWIDSGAPGPADEKREADPRDHWSFRSPLRPSVPPVSDPRWSRNPIDAFIAAAHKQHQLKPVAEAERSLLLRRVYLDLIGLPPTSDELLAFENDKSPDAYERVVDRLLKSEAHGERWGRHWMDIWRYSDWWGLGAEVRNSQKHMWHWRDWIIESLNADKGYDQMLREMLAADELYPTDTNRLRATGYLARSYFRFNRTTWLDEVIEHTSKGLMGLTFNCAKCHDHKYDPYPQVDYYRYRAIFEPYQVRMDFLPGETDLERDGLPRVFDCNLEQPTFLHIRGNDTQPQKDKPIVPQLPGFLAFDEFAITPLTLPLEAHQPGLKPHVLADHLRDAEAKRQSAEKIAKTARDALQSAREQLQKAQAAAAAKPAEQLPAEIEPDAAVLARELFKDQPRDRWEIVAGKWTFPSTGATQAEEGAVQSAIRLKQWPPVDFEARTKFTITGGLKYRSVGIKFDSDAQNELLVYLSGMNPGGKLQLAIKTGGKQSYPPAAALAREVPSNRLIELAIQVRGRLVIMHVDGQRLLSYTVPMPRRAGPIELITFDAQAQFHEFELRALPGGSKGDPAPVTSVAAAEQQHAQAAAALSAAEQSLAHLKQIPAVLNARAAATAAAHQQPAPENKSTLAAEAAKLERAAAVAKAEADLAQAEADALRIAPEKKADADKKTAAARTALDTARKAAEKPGETFAELTGSLKTMESNLESDAARRKPFPTTSTGRRTMLAHWLTDPRHPLVARVAANHLWSRHMGRPLVPTLFDFGRKGQPPTHGELLDYLATELVANEWSMKHLHRLIVTSQTYRLSGSSAAADEATVKQDSENRYYWRRNAVRMEAQAVRDSLLQLAGELDRTLYGPSIPVGDESSRRRSLYYVHSHNDHQKFLSIFDDAGVQECYRRTESIVPQQALALSNSKLALSMAGKIAERLGAADSERDDAAFVARAWRLILCGEPTADEVATCQAAIEQWRALAQQAKRADGPMQARVRLVEALLNHNDFVTIR